MTALESTLRTWGHWAVPILEIPHLCLQTDLDDSPLNLC